MTLPASKFTATSTGDPALGLGVFTERPVATQAGLTSIVVENVCTLPSRTTSTARMYEPACVGQKLHEASVVYPPCSRTVELHWDQSAFAHT